MTVSCTCRSFGSFCCFGSAGGIDVQMHLAVKLALERRFRKPLDVKLTLERQLRSPWNVKLALERPFQKPWDVKFALERRFQKALDVQLALEPRFWVSLNVQLALDWRNLALGGSGATVGRALGPLWGEKSFSALSTTRSPGRKHFEYIYIYIYIYDLFKKTPLIMICIWHTKTFFF